MGPGIDPVEYDRRVLSSIEHILTAVTADQLDRPTPCTQWSLGRLVGHMIGHHRGFAAAAAGEPVGVEVWEGSSAGADPAVTYQAAAQAVTEAFSAPGLLGRRLVIYRYGTFPATVALNMHSVDFLAHGWDVARALGMAGSLDDQLCAEGLRIAATWPDNEATWGPTGPFQRRVAVPDQAPAYQRLMGYLGRDPDWAPSG